MQTKPQMPNLKERLNSNFREIALQVRPLNHGVGATFIGSVNGAQAGTVIYGYYNMDYRLPNGDYLRIIANHNKSIPQILLFTHDPEKLKQLPGGRPASLIAECMRQLNSYLSRSNSYAKPRHLHQEKKYQFAKQCLLSLTELLKEERNLSNHDWSGQEKLRTQVISLIEHCRNQNRLLANTPIVSEGYLGSILYKAKQTAQHYQFNRVFPVSRIDQLDFTEVAKNFSTDKKPCFVWDSEIHIKQDEQELNNTLRVISELYGFTLPSSLYNIPANRFERLGAFFNKLYKEARQLANHLSKAQPIHEKQAWTRSDGLTLTTIKPYYRFRGLNQVGHSTLESLINSITHLNQPCYITHSKEQAYEILTTKANGHWVHLPYENQVIIRIKNNMIALRYFKENELFYPMPSGEDLVTLSHLSKKHLFLPEKINLQFKAFLSSIPRFFKYIFNNLTLFFKDLRNDFVKHIHSEHAGKEEQVATKKPVFLKSIVDIMIGHGLLKNGQSLEEFIQEHINNNNYIIVREEHAPHLTFYTNPLHKVLNIARHFAMFFVSKSEENPLMGSLAMLAYLYGGGAIIAPEALKAVLLKLHLNGLIAGIEPTQKLGKWMSHGTISEAISAAVIYWQGIVVSGNLDDFFMQAVVALRDNPAEIAIILSLALGLGYGLCKAIPVLQKEMGPHPEINYLALGAKGGAAIYDTVMHPGDDWLLGTIKWFFKGIATLGKIILSPLIEAHYYGYPGFLTGIKKSAKLSRLFLKQIGVAILDLLLSLSTVFFLEIATMLLHVPFRGLTDFLSRSLGMLGELKSIGAAFIAFAKRPGNQNFLAGLRLMPLYGYTNPLGTYHKNPFLNFLINSFWLIALPLFQTCKNFIFLPCIDTFFILTRLSLTIFNPLSRFVAYPLGLAILAVASIWDETIGPAFRLSAQLITHSSNWIEQQVGFIKQFFLSKIQICRQYLYYQTFAEDDKKLFQTYKNSDYFLESPIRIDQLEHTAANNSQRFLNVLLNTVSPSEPLLAETLPSSANEVHHAALFVKQGQQHNPSETLNEKSLSI
ncbi:membrane protein [Legionella busanensis]|uniref:Membrane protein n=1 Tax=Legionella busanensis TaxID=190655 RepID=A0A378JKV9_9GAMM|nr:hypothetical protein [Legionella busanensis]STX51875.1 membrane protein [Legionella busanensis]